MQANDGPFNVLAGRLDRALHEREGIRIGRRTARAATAASQSRNGHYSTNKLSNLEFHWFDLMRRIGNATRSSSRSKKSD